MTTPREIAAGAQAIRLKDSAADGAADAPQDGIVIAHAARA